jgi:hypothetical protein
MSNDWVETARALLQRRGSMIAQRNPFPERNRGVLPGVDENPGVRARKDGGQCR